MSRSDAISLLAPRTYPPIHLWWTSSDSVGLHLSTAKTSSALGRLHRASHGFIPIVRSANISSAHRAPYRICPKANISSNHRLHIDIIDIRARRIITMPQASHNSKSPFPFSRKRAFSSNFAPFLQIFIYNIALFITQSCQTDRVSGRAALSKFLLQALPSPTSELRIPRGTNLP